MDEMLLFIELVNAEEIINDIERKVKEYELSDETKASMMGMLFDVLFKEKSVEVAKRVSEAVAEVNGELGTYED